jgi:hypothetical protein
MVSSVVIRFAVAFVLQQRAAFFIRVIGSWKRDAAAQKTSVETHTE